MSIIVSIDTYIGHQDAYIYHDEHGNNVWTNKYRVVSNIQEHSYGILVTTTKVHGFSVDDEITLVETTNYNYSTEIISVESTRSFTLGLTYVADEESGYVGNADDIKDIEVALRKSTEWIDNHPNYKGNWKGTVTSSTQILSHPRMGLYDEENRSYSSSLIADKVEYACAIMANKIIEDSEDIFPDINTSDFNLKRKKVDVIEREWFSPRESKLRKKYDKVDQLLSSLTLGYGNSKTIVRGY